MSEAPHTPSRGEEMLARLAELDLAAAEQAHARMMAAPDDTFDAAARTYQRMARSLRQTLALKARLERGEVRPLPAARPPHPPVADMAEAERVADLQEAVARVAVSVLGDGRACADALDRFDRELDDWTEADDFTTEDLDVQVLRACRLLDLPEDLAANWRALPKPRFVPEPLAVCDAEPDRAPLQPASPPVAWPDTG